MTERHVVRDKLVDRVLASFRSRHVVVECLDTLDLDVVYGAFAVVGDDFAAGFFDGFHLIMVVMVVRDENDVGFDGWLWDSDGFPVVRVGHDCDVVRDLETGMTMPSDLKH